MSGRSASGLVALVRRIHSHWALRVVSLAALVALGLLVQLRHAPVHAGQPGDVYLPIGICRSEYGGAGYCRGHPRPRSHHNRRPAGELRVRRRSAGLGVGADVRRQRPSTRISFSSRRPGARCVQTTTRPASGTQRSSVVTFHLPARTRSLPPQVTGRAAHSAHA